MRKIVGRRGGKSKSIKKITKVKQNLLQKKSLQDPKNILNRNEKARAVKMTKSNISKHGKKWNPLNSLGFAVSINNHDELYKLMEVVHHILTKHNIKYSAIEGTLLGAFRDGGIIAHDDDIDLIYEKKEDWLCLDWESYDLKIWSKKSDPRLYIYWKDHPDVEQILKKYQPKPAIEVFNASDFGINLQQSKILLKKFGKFKICCLQDPWDYLEKQYGKDCLTTIVVTPPHLLNKWKGRKKYIFPNKLKC